MTIKYLKKSPKTSSTDDTQTTEIVKNLLKEKIDEDLFLYSYDYVGDLAETFSLLWPSDNSK